MKEVDRDKFENTSVDGGVNYKITPEDNAMEKKIKEIFNALNEEFIWLSQR